MHSAETKWNTLRDAMYNTALTTYGKERKITDEYEANITVMEPVTEAKRYALVNLKRDPSKKNLITLRAARKKAQQTVRRCANNYWLQLCQNIQPFSDTWNIRGMYDGINKATGPPMKKTAPLKTKTGRSSPNAINKWRGGWSTTSITSNCTPEKILSPRRQ